MPSACDREGDSSSPNSSTEPIRYHALHLTYRKLHPLLACHKSKSEYYNVFYCPLKMSFRLAAGRISLRRDSAQVVRAAAARLDRDIDAPDPATHRQ